MKRAAVLIIVMLISAPAWADDLAIVGGDVYTVSGAMIPAATIVVRGERIVQVGKDIPIPPTARIIDAKGKPVTPGFIDSHTSLGLVEISLEPSTVDAFPGSKDPIRAAARMATAVDLRSTLIGVARRQGITSAISAPAGGLISGRAAFIDLVGPDSRLIERAVVDAAGMFGVLGEQGGAAVGGSRATAMLRLEEALDEARIYRRSKTAYTRRALHELSTSRLDLEALQDVLTQRVPLVLRASRASDIIAALDMAKRQRIRIVITGANEAWMVADRLVAARVPVIVNVLENLPFTFEARNARTDNAALLARAGVKVAITTESSHNAGNLRFHLGNAVRAGLVRELALRAATLTPAEIFGVDRQYGALDRGKMANIVVWTGDPFEPSSYAETVVIRGEVQPTENRQSKLAERYIQRLNLRQTGKAD